MEEETLISLGVDPREARRADSLIGRDWMTENGSAWGVRKASGGKVIACHNKPHLRGSADNGIGHCTEEKGGGGLESGMTCPHRRGGIEENSFQVEEKKIY